MEPTHVMSFAGSGSVLESITLCGVEPGHVDKVTVHKGELGLLRVTTLCTEDGDTVSAGLVLANRAAMEGRAGMRVDFGLGLQSDDGVWTSGAPIVLQAWLSPTRPAAARLQVVVTYRPDR